MGNQSSAQMHLSLKTPSQSVGQIQISPSKGGKRKEERAGEVRIQVRSRKQSDVKQSDARMNDVNPESISGSTPQASEGSRINIVKSQPGGQIPHSGQGTTSKAAMKHGEVSDKIVIGKGATTTKHSSKTPEKPKAGGV